MSLLLHPHLAVNKSAGNPLRPFFKSAGSAFWELPPAGKGVSGERMPGQTGTQRPQVSGWHLGHTAVSILLLLLSPSSVRTPSIVLRRSCRRANVGGTAHQLAGHNGPAHAIVPSYCSCSTTTMPAAQPFESPSTLRRRIAAAAHCEGAHTKLCTAHTASCDRLLTGEGQYA